MNKEFAALGAGVIGLTTGILLLEKYPKAKVTIYAAQTTGLVSEVAGAQFYPIWLGDNMPKSFDATLRKWYLYSKKRFEALQGPEYDIKRLQNFELTKNPMVPEYFYDVLPDLKITKEDNLPEGYSHMLSFETIVINPFFHLPYLKNRFLELGGKIQIKHFASQKDILELRQEIIINCLGCGANLFNDQYLKPVKGVSLRLKPIPQIKHVVSYDDHIIAPRSNDTYIGASYIEDSQDFNVNEQEKNYVFESIKRTMESPGQPFSVPKGSLKKQNIISSMVGFRPARSIGPRVEKEIIGSKLIVHNYGHGGNGVILSWGSSRQAMRLATS